MSSISQRFLYGTCLIFVLAGCADREETATPAVEVQSVEEPASLALTGGEVYTMNPEYPWAEAVAVRGKEIVYVGDASGLAAYTGPDTETVSLDGKMVLPGFVDGHIHTVAGGLIMKGVDLQSDSIPEIFQKLSDHVETNTDPVVMGYGVRFNPWTNGFPTAAMIDEIESERPVYLWAIDGHAAWVNSKALELAGVGKDAPDVVPGFSFYHKYDDGQPTGWIEEVPAQMAVLTKLINIDADSVAQGTKDWLNRFATMGITSVHDLGIVGADVDAILNLYQRWEQQGELPVRIQAVEYWNDPGLDPLPILKERRQKFNSELVKVSHLKINLDGGDDKWNALYKAPYSDKPDLVPEPIIPYDVLNRVVLEADAAGIDVTCHCFGDLAVAKLLDAVELAIESNPARDRRNVVTHGTFVDTADLPRFKELGVTYDSAGTWMAFDPLLQNVSIDRLGPVRVHAMFPMKAIDELGGNISLGSDWPVSGYISSVAPLNAIETAVTRQALGAPKMPPLGGAKAALPLDRALAAQTIGAAYGMGTDHIVGSLEVGKKADLVVLGKNLFEIDPDDIAEVPVLATVMNGEFTYREGL